MIILNENLPMSYTVVQMLPIITKDILIDAVENHVSSFQTEHSDSSSLFYNWPKYSSLLSPAAKSAVYCKSPRSLWHYIHPVGHSC